MNTIQWTDGMIGSIDKSIKATMTMIRRVLVVVKPLDVFPPRLPALNQNTGGGGACEKVLRYLDDRCRVHKETIQHCWAVVRRRFPDCRLLMRSHLSSPHSLRPEEVDLVITVGGDGTLLKTSHFLTAGSGAAAVPALLGVNSDPTDDGEVDRMSDQFDASRSTGYLCAATRANFQQLLDDIVLGQRIPTDLSRLSVKINAEPLPTFALNDVLLAHPCPASVSRFSFRIRNECGEMSRLVSCRSSGLRVCTAAGSTAAMQSAGGIPMHISMRDLQYMVREPISPRELDIPLMHGFIKQDNAMLVSWYSQDGMVYVDGSHVHYKIKHGDEIEVAPDAPVLKVFLPDSLLA